MRTKARIHRLPVVIAALFAALSAAAAGPAWLGVHVAEGPAGSPTGARVERVLIGSPAEAAGVLVGDVIVDIDGRPVVDAAAVRARIAALAPGDRATISVERDGMRRTLDVRLGERPETPGAFAVAPDLLFNPGDDADRTRRHAEAMKELAERLRGLEGLEGLRWTDEDDRPAPLVERWIAPLSRPILGVELIDVTPELRRHLGTDRDAGVLVGKVLADSAAENAGIRVGDLILSVDGEEVRSSSALAAAVRSRAGGKIVVEVLRDGGTSRLEVELPEAELPRPFARS